MTNSKSRSLALALLASSALSTPALAQQAELQPPARQTVDQNGVDLSLGKLQASSPAISIGSPGQGLTFSRSVIVSTAVSGWSNPYKYALFGDPATSIQAVAGDSSISFNFNSGTSTYVNQQGTGETLTRVGNSWTFTLRDGTVVALDTSAFDPNASSLNYSGNNAVAAATSVILPNKRKLTFAYRMLSWEGAHGITSRIRLQSAQSSNGYMAKFEYADNGSLYTADWIRVTKATLLNNAIDYCNPSADSCTFSTSWPTLNFAYVTGAQPEIDTVTDSLNRSTVFTFGYADNANGKLKAIRRPTSATDNTTAVYDSNGRVQSVTIDGRTWNYSWSLAAPLMTATITNPDTSTKVYITNTTTNQVTSYKDELNRTTTYQYDTLGRLTDVTYPESNVLHYTYDARGNVTEARAKSKTPGTPADIVKSASYPSTCTNAVTCNQPTSVTDPRGNVTLYSYDSTHGGVLIVTSPPPTGASVCPLDGTTICPQTRYGYTGLQAYYKNSSGSIVASGQTTYLPTSTSACQTLWTCTGGSDEVKTTISYGPQVAGTANNLLPVSMSTGSGDGGLTATSAYTYDNVGNSTYVDGPLSGTADTTRTLYDAGRQVVGQISPDPDGGGTLPNRAARLTYNGDGQVTKSERGTTAGQTDAAWAAFSPAEFVDTVYDASGRKTTETLKNGSTSYALTQYSYDSVGRLGCTAARMNPAVYNSLPTSACSLSPMGSYGPDQISQAVYDAASEVTQIKVGVATGDAATQRTLSYTNNGFRQYLIDGMGARTQYSYDGFDRPLLVTYPAASRPSAYDDSTQATALATAGTVNAGDYEQFYYDASSNVTSYRARSSDLINFGYDNLDRRTSMSSLALANRAYTYDLLDRLLTATFQSGGQGITNTYDALSRLISSSSNVGGTAHALSYLYDLTGQRTRLTWWDGFYVDYDRLVTGEISKVRANGAVSGSGVLATYVYDNLGRQSSLTRDNGAVTSWGYDPVSRLATLTHAFPVTASNITVSNSYDPASRIVSQTRSNDAYSYNGYSNQNTTSSSNGLNRITNAGFNYDTNGNLIADGTRNYVYDIENKLISTTGGPGSTSLSYDPLNRLDVYNPGTSTRFIYDRDEAVALLDSSGNITRREVRGDGDDEVLVEYNTSDRRYFHLDERNSAIAWTDPAGSVASISTYDEYGIPASSNPGFFQYTGQIWLSYAGVYNYKARAYSPVLGRFMQIDPIGPEDDANLYAYSLDDPINNADPSGLEVNSNPIYIWGVPLQNGPLESRQEGALFVLGNSIVGDVSRVSITDEIRIVGRRLRWLLPRLGNSRRQCTIPSDPSQMIDQATREALKSIGDRRSTQPLGKEFSLFLGSTNFRTGGWRNVYSSHSMTAFEHDLPGYSGLVVKVYLGDANLGGANTAAISPPTHSPAHVISWLPWRLGVHVNQTFAYRYLKSKGCS